MRVELPHVDVVICTTCELRCVGCTNFMGAVRPEVFPLTDVKRDVDMAARVLRARQATILGGEPLGHPRLVEIMRHVKASGIAEWTEVLTNGVRLHKMRDDFWQELDRLKISVYPDTTPPENIDLAIERAADHGFVVELYKVGDDPFRAVLTRHERDDADAQRTYDDCWYRTYTRKIERGYFWRCCTSPGISQVVLGLPPDTDGIPLDGLTPEKLQTFLDRPTFMNSCRRCYGNTGPRIAWTEERDRTRWLEVSSV